MNPTNETIVHNGNTPSDTNIAQKLNQLIESCMESDKSFYSAAEQIDNRGMKLLVKSYAQQHAQFTTQLQSMVRQMGDIPPENRDPVAAVGRGLTDVKAAMTVKRAGRQHLVLEEALQSENKTLNAYTEALKTALPEQIRDAVAQQAARLRTIQGQLKLLAGEAQRQLVVRLYNRADEAKMVVNQLQQAGFSSDEIYATSIEQAARVYTADTQERGKSKGQTIIATGLAGAGFGLVLGVLLGIFQNLLAPNTLGFLPASGIGVVFLVGLIGAVIGAIFGLIFGLLIGQDKTEEDTYLYTESLQDGDTLVVVFTNDQNKAKAEQIVGLKHQREIKPAA